jgi:phosphatidylinositol-3,4,5-trisphosphate 3-phosphatase/dual-specificity protein phosphatase PTEN
MIERFCNSVDSYLAKDPINVVGIHCKAGKGRTGLMVACYLMHSAQCLSAEKALELFAQQRTMDMKGVTIPSQIRYVHYYDALIRRSEVLDYTYQIMSIRFNSVPNFDPAISGGGCDPYIVVKALMKDPSDHITWKKYTVFNQFEASGHAVQKYKPQDETILLDLKKYNLYVNGDIHMMLYDHDVYSADEKMCGLWFNTAFIEANYLCFEKSVLDAAVKDKRNLKFDADFKLEIFFRRVDKNTCPMRRDFDTDDAHTGTEAGIEDDEDDL